MAAKEILAGGRKRRKPKPKVVSLGKKGSFKITKPGVFRAKAKKAGMTTRQAAQKWMHRSDETGRQARSANAMMHFKR